MAEQVDRWANQFRGVGQRPYLAGTAADFDLAPLVVKEPGSTAKPALKDEDAAGRGRRRTEDKEGEGKQAGERGEGEGNPRRQGRGESPQGAKTAASGAGKKAADSDEPAYPPELKTGWELREAWWKGSGTGSSPAPRHPGSSEGSRRPS